MRRLGAHLHHSDVLGLRPGQSELPKHGARAAHAWTVGSRDHRHVGQHYVCG